MIPQVKLPRFGFVFEALLHHLLLPFTTAATPHPPEAAAGGQVLPGKDEHVWRDAKQRRSPPESHSFKFTGGGGGGGGFHLCALQGEKVKVALM